MSIHERARKPALQLDGEALTKTPPAPRAPATDRTPHRHQGRPVRPGKLLHRDRLRPTN